MKSTSKGVFLWVFLLLVLMLAVTMASGGDGRQANELPYSELIQAVRQQQVTDISIKGQEVTGSLTDGSEFTTTGPADVEHFEKVLFDNDLVPDYEQESSGTLLQIAMTVIPMAVIFVLFMLFMRQLQSGGGKAMSFGKSKARLQDEGGKKVTFADVAGADEAKDELEEVIQFLKDPRRFTRLGGRIPKGVLLMGPPGTGKTLLARAVAGEAEVPFFSISGSDFIEMFVGVGASRVRDLFEQGRKKAPCIIFIDEIDAVGRTREGGAPMGAADERHQTLNQLLVEMDGFEGTEGVILMAATNRPDVLDPALLRPGRFDRRVVVSNPDVRGREGILKIHCRRTPLHEDVELDVIARATPGFSGADLEALVNEAALVAARDDQESVTMDDFEAARDKVSMGAERRSLVVPERSRRRTAYHEAGHAIVARLLPEADKVHKVTIVPRGRALGATQVLPQEDALDFTRAQLRSRIAFIMGGRAAERLIFQETTTGASNDLKQATRIARAMVTEFGMSDAIGPMSIDGGGGSGFLGEQFGRLRNVSEDTAQRIDRETRTILEDADALALSILKQNTHILERLAQLLLDTETVDGDEFEEVVLGLNPVYPVPEPGTETVPQTA
jgi:cell division protease FtsH